MAHKVVLIPGDGTGPELTEATRRALEVAGGLLVPVMVITAAVFATIGAVALVATLLLAFVRQPVFAVLWAATVLGNIGSFRISAMIMGETETGELQVLGSGHRASAGRSSAAPTNSSGTPRQETIRTSRSTKRSAHFTSLTGICPAAVQGPGSVHVTLPPLGYAVCDAR